MSDLMPWLGRAGMVRIGHMLQGMKRTKGDVWEVTEMKNPAQIEFGYTLWWRVVNTTTGEVLPVPPRNVRARVTFMLTPEEYALAEQTKRAPDKPHQWPVDSDEVLMLAETLGAREIATRDNVTGEVTCPSYATGAHHAPEWRPGILLLDEIEHLKICHGLDVSGLEGIVDHNERLKAVATTHGGLHGPRSARMAHKGFPHRHTPEDHSLL